MATTQRILQNNRLLWVDANINTDNKDTQHELEQLRIIVHHIDLFTQINDCFQFLEKINQEKALIITSGTLGQELVKKTHHLAQVDAIYIFCGNPDRHETWAKNWSKIKGIHNRIKPLCEALRTAVKQTNEDLTSISFVTQSLEDNQEKSIDDLNRLEASSMYTHLFKRILLYMKHDSNARQAIVKFCRFHHADNPGELKIIDEFDREYRADKAIWWYTRECFTYKMLNRALRLLESDIIVDMGFFIHDLHRALEELHRQQYSDYSGSPLTLYRGQALSMEDFTKLKKSRGGLLAFNSFLSASTSKTFSLDFADRSSKRDNMFGIFFVMTVDPTIRSVVFANITKHGYLQIENEVLFSMHTVFRINEIVGLDEQKRLFEVRLASTSEDDHELSRLADHIVEQWGDGTDWKQLEQVLVKMGELKKAEELYLFQLERKPDESDQRVYYHRLGLIKVQQGDYKNAVKYYDQAISITERILPADHPDLAAPYNNIGEVYSKMGEYSQALSYYDKALAIREKTLTADHHDLVATYNNIGRVYSNMRDYSRAVSYYNKALAIREKTLPENHPDLATSYHNIGELHSKMGEYSQAVSYYNKVLAIREKTLPDNHPDLGAAYNKIGRLYSNMGEYSQAVSYYNKTLAIREKTLTADHPDLAATYNNIGRVYYKSEEYIKAKTFFEKASVIRKSFLLPEHADVLTSKKWLELVNEKLQK